MLGTVIEIDGDYAVVRYDVTGTESHVALAILGDAEIGDKGAVRKLPLSAQ